MACGLLGANQISKFVLLIGKILVKFESKYYNGYQFKQIYNNIIKLKLFCTHAGNYVQFYGK